MTDLVGQICAAIFRQEGMPANYPNPGNLRGAPWISSAPPMHNGFWTPASRAQGIAGAFHVVALRVAMGHSLRQLIYAWAPPADHNATSQYLMNVSLWTGIMNLDQPLLELLEIPAQKPLT